jgi:hypothetical protein
MPTARPFAYNIGAGITGTVQVGNLAIGTPEVGFSATGLEWWNGPDEELGYVIACQVPGDSQPTPVPGVSASVGFFRSTSLTENSFIDLANYIANPLGGGPFASGSAANTWLNSNGFWSSFVGSTGATGDFIVTVSQVGPHVVWSGSGSLNTTALTLDSTNTISAGFNANTAIWAIGSTVSVTAGYYSGSITYPSTFGTNGVPASTGSGDTVGVLPGGSGRIIVLPNSYVSGTPISGSTTYNGQTIAGMGLSAGTYTWSWGSGGNASSIVMTIS